LKYFFIAGEESGSNYAASVIQQLKLIDKKSKFYGLGNDLMNLEGCDIIIPIQELAFMGFSDVVRNIFTIKRNFSKTKNAILDIQPDVICLIDYAGFNLKMAKWCKQNGFKVLYYILPKVWAWNEKRINILKQYCDVLISIFSFEQQYFKTKNIDTLYFGNPLKEIYEKKGEDINLQHKKHAIALLPGSRKQEIKKLLPIFIQLAIRNPTTIFYLSAISAIKNMYTPNLPINIKLIYDDMSAVLKQSNKAVVCSGTATLETTILKVPQVIVYKTNFVNYQIAKRIAKVKYIGLPNLIAEKEIVTELIQEKCTVENIEIELNKLENNTAIYDILDEKLKGNQVSKNVAEVLFRLSSQ
jgi:lipid-A-disaccharide synthase